MIAKRIAAKASGACRRGVTICAHLFVERAARGKLFDAYATIVGARLGAKSSFSLAEICFSLPKNPTGIKEPDWVLSAAKGGARGSERGPRGARGDTALSLVPEVLSS